MRAILPILTGTILFAVLIYVSADYHKNEIEADLTQRTRSALGNLSAPAVEVLAEAQTITLQGEVATEDARKRLQDEAARVWGVAEVRNELRVAALLSPGSCETVVDTLAGRDPVRFLGKDSAELDPASYPSLDRLAGLLSECPEAAFQVEGFGPAALAEARAEAVVRYLIVRGIPETRLTPRSSSADAATSRIGVTLRAP